MFTDYIYIYTCICLRIYVLVHVPPHLPRKSTTTCQDTGSGKLERTGHARSEVASKSLTEKIGRCSRRGDVVQGIFKGLQQKGVGQFFMVVPSSLHPGILSAARAERLSGYLVPLYEANKRTSKPGLQMWSQSFSGCFSAVQVPSRFVVIDTLFPCSRVSPRLFAIV